MGIAIPTETATDHLDLDVIFCRLHVSEEALAAAMGERLSDVMHWLHGQRPVPVQALDKANALYQRFSAMAERFALELFAGIQNRNSVVILLYPDEVTLWQHHPDFIEKMGSSDFHESIVFLGAYTARELLSETHPDEEFDFRVTYLDGEQYQIWLTAHDCLDTPESRSEWATSQPSMSLDKFFAQ